MVTPSLFGVVNKATNYVDICVTLLDIPFFIPSFHIDWMVRGVRSLGSVPCETPTSKLPSFLLVNIVSRNDR